LKLSSIDLSGSAENLSVDGSGGVNIKASGKIENPSGADVFNLFS